MSASSIRPWRFTTKYSDDKNAILGANINDTEDPDDDIDDDDNNNNYNNNTDDDAAIATIDDDGMHDDIATLGSRGVESPLGVAVGVDPSTARDADSLGVAVGVDPSSTTNAVSTVSTPISLSLSHNDLAAVTPFAESLGLCGEALLAVIKFTEDIIKRRVKATYGSFISLTDPILIDSDLNAMVDFTFSKLPHQCFIIAHVAIGIPSEGMRDRKSNDSRRIDGRSDSRRSVDASKEEVGIEQLLLFEHGSSHLHDITS